MAIQNVTNFSDSVRARYLSDYEAAAEMVRLYDQLAYPIAQDMSRVARGSSVYVPFASDMTVGTTAISEATDITPQALEDATSSLTPTSRGEALQSSELLMLQAYTDYGAERFRAVGKNAMESIDVLARDAACKGDLYVRETTRALLNAGSTGHRAHDGMFTEASTLLSTLKCPGFPVKGGTAWAAITHPAAYHDLREDGNVVSIAQYQQADIILNFELGALGPFRLIVSPWAKVFGGAGADNDNAVATTLQCQTLALDKTFKVAAHSKMHYGAQYYTIGCEETGSTHYPTNEIVRFISHETSVCTMVGEAANGGLRFPHPTSAVVNNADNVYTIVFGGPQSLAKVYQPSVGPFGTVVGPKMDGIVDQFVTLGWKFYGNYGLMAENRIVRGEVSSSVQA